MATCPCCAGSLRGYINIISIIAFWLLMSLIRASLVSSEQLVLYIPICPTDTTVLTVIYHNIIETRPRATMWAKALDFTKQSFLLGILTT